MRLTKFSLLTFISLFLLALLISFSSSIQSIPITAVTKPKTLAFIALQQRGSEATNSLYTIQANGKARRQLSQNQDVNPTLVWSPNGQRVAFVSGESDVYLVNVDGSSLTKLLSGNVCKASDFKIVWAASNKIVLTQHCDGFTSDTPGSETLYLSDTTGQKGTKPIQSWEVGGVPPKTEISSYLHLSPNGQQVVFVKDENIYKMNTDGSGLTNLTNKPGDYVSAGSRLVWSPDGTRIAFLYGKYPKQQIYVINADGKNLKNLTNNPENQVYDINLFWSPDSTRIAYYHHQPGDMNGDRQDIYSVNASGGTPLNLTKKPGAYGALSWSPDGKQIAFIAGEFSNQKLYTVNSDGSKLTELLPRLPLSGVYDLAWSSDSQQIAFTTDKGGKNSLCVVNRDGSGLTKLTNSNDLGAYTPTWQP